MSIHKMQLPSAFPFRSTGMVPSPCVEQHTAITSAGADGSWLSKRRDARRKLCHHSSGFCSTPPSGVRIKFIGSTSHASTFPLTVIRATFIPEVPRSTARRVFSLLMFHAIFSSNCVAIKALITTNPIKSMRAGVKDPFGAWRACII